MCEGLKINHKVITHIPNKYKTMTHRLARDNIIFYYKTEQVHFIPQKELGRSKFLANTPKASPIHSTSLEMSEVS